jgi:hypothetical protein
MQIISSTNYTLHCRQGFPTSGSSTPAVLSRHQKILSVQKILSPRSTYEATGTTEA